jgi:UDP-N-acetylglucosamine diphosphorylase/glucosamine-1-phosphate N-acetyltransferase
VEPIVVLFEDHAAEDFRPLSWSLPVYEIRCGLLALRERVQYLARGGTPGLLPRRLLLPLQRSTAADGAAVGADGCRPRVAQAGALYLNARLGPDWSQLAALLAAGADADWTWWESDSLLACRLAPEPALAFLDAWVAWDADADNAGIWTAGQQRAPRFVPVSARPGPTVAERRAFSVPTTAGIPTAFAHLWDIVAALGPAIAADAPRICGGERSLHRRPFGIATDPKVWPAGAPWESAGCFGPLSERPGVSVVGGPVWTGPETRIAPGVVVDAGPGPVVLDRAVTVQPHVYLQGPLYVGPGAIIKAGARIYGETSIGIGCRVAGEIGESLFLDFGNKQHDGFIGHAALGSWINLGAGTTCSDLKNNYGPVRVEYGLGEIDSGLRFVGLMMGEHAKSAIGTLFNTATVVGYASNVFGAGFPPKYLPNFTWGDPGGPRFDGERAAEVARVVTARRGCLFGPEQAALLAALATVA